MQHKNWILAWLTIFSLTLSACTEKEIGDFVDLTGLSKTILTGEIANIYNNPEKYLGKTIKIQGFYYAGFYNLTQKYYHYVIIEPADECCMDGLEFLLTAENGDDFPEEYAPILIEGVYSSYEELGVVVYYILANEIVLL